MGIITIFVGEPFVGEPFEQSLDASEWYSPEVKIERCTNIWCEWLLDMRLDCSCDMPSGCPADFGKTDII